MSDLKQTIVLFFVFIYVLLIIHVVCFIKRFWFYCTLSFGPPIMLGFQISKKKIKFWAANEMYLAFFLQYVIGLWVRVSLARLFWIGWNFTEKKNWFGFWLVQFQKVLPKYKIFRLLQLIFCLNWIKSEKIRSVTSVRLVQNSGLFSSEFRLKLVLCSFF